jgi:predicted nucleotidyltransferase component of viral defense system
MNIYDQMVAEYQQQASTSTPNVEQEVMQKIALAGLSRGGFFKHAAFYGGTCLRLFHRLPRYSEDMDFTLREKNSDVHLEDFFSYIIEEFHLAGHEVVIQKKDILSPLRRGGYKAGFKENTEVFDIKFQTKKTVKVKIEMDTDPPLGFETEDLPLSRPYPFVVRCVALPDLYAGKMHALLYRNWKTRVKGRDWYDFQWYVANSVPLNFEHLQKRIHDFNDENITKERFMEMLHEKFSTTDMEAVKQDVRGFIFDQRDIEVWSNDYFLKLADMIVFKE